jgi:predicted nucleotidyltransferase
MNNNEIILFIKEQIKNKYGKEFELRIVTHFGSITYGTSTPTSDIDITVVYDYENEEEFQYLSPDLDIQFISIPLFIRWLNECNIKSLETYFYKDKIINTFDDIKNFRVILFQLRKSISSIVNNSWVKAKKKVLLEDEDNYIGFKSLFHSFRILLFGIQLAKTNSIYDFTEGNKYWIEIMEMVKNGISIEEILLHFKPIHNQLQTEFRKLAPKEEMAEELSL